MAASKIVFPVGRALLVVGAVLLLAGMLLPWFRVMGTQSQLPAGEYDGAGATNLFNNLSKTPYAWAAYVWLVLVMIFAVISALIGRKFSNFGTSGVLVLALYGILITVADNLVSQGVTSGAAEVSLSYGYFTAIIGSGLIEGGSRLLKPRARPEKELPPQPPPPLVPEEKK